MLTTQQTLQQFKRAIQEFNLLYSQKGVNFRLGTENMFLQQGIDNWNV